MLTHKGTLGFNFGMIFASALAVLLVTLVLSSISLRLFLDSALHSPRPYGLLYVVIISWVTLRGGRRWGWYALALSLLAAAYVLPPRTSLTIGDDWGWGEIGLLTLIGSISVLAMDTLMRQPHPVYHPGTETVAAQPPGAAELPSLLQFRWRLSRLLFPLYALPMRMLRRTNQVLIFSHMRSGSSLLVHLLISHPEILGYGETQLTYSRESDFNVLLGKVLLIRRRIFMARERYCLDKVLHDNLLKPENLHLLATDRVRLVILVRDPREAITSLMKTFGDTEEGALEHYLQRMKTITCAAEVVAQTRGQRQPVAVTYQQLLDQTEECFRLLENYLELSQPLKSTYDILPTTGRSKIGDISENIQSGKIIRPRKNDLKLSATTLIRAQDAYQNCIQRLAEICQMPQTADSIKDAGEV